MSCTEQLFDADAVTCAICQEDCKGGDLVWEITACRHIFHKTCISPWAERKTCPTCRGPFNAPTAAPMKKIIAYAFTTKIVNTLLICDYNKELFAINEIIRHFKLNREIKMDAADINTTNLQTFYESYEMLSAELCSFYNLPSVTELRLMPEIQCVARELIRYHRMYDLITRCTLPLH